MNDSSTHSLSIGRRIRAPITVVFDAWLNKELMQVVMRTEVRMDFHLGVYKRTDPPNRVSFVGTSDTADAESIVDISLLAVDEGHTMVLLTHDGLKNRQFLQHHREGWRRTLDRLAAILEVGF